MNVLILNAGSSTLKFKVINMIYEETIISGICERIGIDGVVAYAVGNGTVNRLNVIMKTYDEAVLYVIKLLRGNIGNFKSVEISAIGHRVAHGGERFTEPTIINEQVIKGIEECVELAPLHNMASLKVIEACGESLKSVPMFAVFDTAFHQTMPQKAYMYGIPYDMYEQYKVRKYGFHGMSHKYAAIMAAEYVGIPLNNSRIIVCHLGSGSSVTAIFGGKSIDTSMGFTPLEGLIMGTRTGDIDPSVIGYLSKKMKLSNQDIIMIFNTESGMKGISQVSSDFRELFKAKEEGNCKAELAVDVYIYRIIKYIGSYIAIMNGVDLIVFTGGVGENSSYVRNEICANFSYIGVDIDENVDFESSDCKRISTAESKVNVVIVAANEELMIARDVKTLMEATRCIKTTQL